MVPKDTLAFDNQGGSTEVSRTSNATYPAMTSFVGSQTRSLSLGRFLVSSTGFHLILAWIVISFGIPTVPPVSKPLVVSIIGSDNSESSAESGRPDRAETRRPSAPGPVASPAKAMAKPQVSPPTSAAAPPAPAQVMDADDYVAEPKAVGMAAGGADTAGIGAATAFAMGGPSRGPVVLGPDGDGAVGSGPAHRGGGGGGLDTALVAPTMPSVTVGLPYGTGGGGAGWAGNGAGSGGRFAAANYGINPLPKYPLTAREKGYEGTVYLRVLVRVDGRVERLTVDRSSGYEMLDRAAVDAVREWAFFPAKRGGKTVESWVLLPVKFALN